MGERGLTGVHVFVCRVVYIFSFCLLDDNGRQYLRFCLLKCVFCHELFVQRNEFNSENNAL